MEHTLIHLTPQATLRLQKTTLPPSTIPGEEPARPLQALVAPELLHIGPQAPWPSMQIHAQRLHTTPTGPDTIVHAPRDCEEMMRHAGRTLHARLVGLAREHTLPAPRGMKYPCLAPLMSSLIQAVDRARGRVLLLTGETPLARLLAEELGPNTRVHPPPRRQWPRTHGISWEELDGSEWDTIIAWALTPERLAEVTGRVRYGDLLVSPLLACNSQASLRGARGGVLRVLWPRLEDEWRLRRLEERLLSKNRVLRLGVNVLPARLELEEPAVHVLDLSR